MTASLASAEKGKPLALGRCLFATNDLPLRQPRRISNLVSSAGVRSAPNTYSVGLAGSPHSREATPIQFPGDAARVAAFLPDRRETCGGVRHPTGGRCRIFFYLDRQFGDHAAQNFTKSFGSAAPSMFGPAHVSNMRESHVEVVASAYVNERG